MLSVPFAGKPVYGIDGTNPGPLSICGGVLQEDGWTWASAVGDIREIEPVYTSDSVVEVRLENALGQTENYRITADGIEIIVQGHGKLACALPLFVHDGKYHSIIEQKDAGSAAVLLDGYICRIITPDTLSDTGTEYRHRNGSYRLYQAEGTDTVRLRLVCEKKEK